MADRQKVRSTNSIKANKFDGLKRFAAQHKGWLFRGMRDPDWPLETSLERASRRCGIDQTSFEKKIVKEFRRHAHSYSLPRIPDDRDNFEWLALMQHHGAPTRLLDFTSSFWIALYFAYEWAEKDCVVWALDPSTLGDIHVHPDWNPVLRENIDSCKHMDDNLYQNVPYYTNERLALQKGTFVHSMNLTKSFHELTTSNEKRYKTLRVSRALFPEIRRFLNDLNCTSRVLFPGIDGFARSFQNPDE